MKKLLILLFSLTLSFSSFGEKIELDFLSGTFCDNSPKAQVRNGLFYLPNQEEPYSGENLCVYLSNGQYFSQGEINNGFRVSKWTYWKENGQIEKIEYYKDGKIDEKMVSMQLLNARALYLSYASDSNNVGAYNKLIKEHPSSSYTDQASLLMAKYLFDAGSFSLALDAIKPLISNQSSIISSTAVLRVASIYLQLGQHDEALSTLKIESGKGFSGLIYNLTGDVYLDLGNSDEAKKYYLLAIENITENSNLTQLIQIKLDDLNSIQDYDSRSENNAVASVDGDEILLTTYYQELNLQQRNLQQQLGAQYSQEIDNVLKQTLLETMINEKLIENYANSLDIVTLDQEVRSVIQSNQAFQVDGQFSEDRYNQLLRLNQYKPSSYEAAQSKSLSQEQIKRNLSGSGFLSTIQIKQLNDLASQEREIAYIVLKTDKYEDQISVSQSEISDYFNANKSNFLEGRKVKVDFVEFSLDNIEEPEDADEETLKNLYEENAELYINPERRRAQHILVEDESLANDLLNQIKEGEDFAELAKTNSVDTSSNEQGGDLGLFERDLMGVEFDEAAFSMNVGDVSDVVSTDYGYFHIIKLTEIQTKTSQSFEEVREQLVALHIKNAKQKILFDLEEEFGNLAYEESLDMLADQLDLEIQTSDFFSNRTDQYDQAFVSAAFSKVVIEEGENSDVIELGQNKFVVLSLSSLQPERQKELNEVEAQIVATLKTLGAKKLIDNLSLSIVSALTSGDELTVNTLLTDNELEWNDEGWISRTTQLPFDITNIAYTIPKPIIGEHTYSSKSIDNSTSLVVDLKAVRLPEGENDTGISELYLTQENNEMFISLIKQLRETAEIKVFSDLL